MKKILSIVALSVAASTTYAAKKPNIILYFADDISPREFPTYGSTTWTAPDTSDTSDPQYRAETPVLDKLASEGCWVKTAWASVICNPSRAMMMSGRYAYQTKWWNNKDKGAGHDENGKLQRTWPLYMSSPILIGHAAQKAGYGTFWTGKTQMAGDNELHGFDEGCFTPGDFGATDNKFTNFRHGMVKKKGKRTLINFDTGKPCKTYRQNSWYWAPHVKLMNHPSAPNQTVWWPNTRKSKKEFGLHTYGPDVELDFAFDFMDRKHKEKKPFFIYHTSHLGHDAFNWLDPEGKKWGKCKWPNAPIVKWNGKKYTRTKPRITGKKGNYDAHGTITKPGIHNHINYIDYQIWLYQQKLKKMGIADNTIIIVCADNGTSMYGKASSISQKGSHVPLFIYAPGMKKQGEQDILVSLTDIMPTVADIVGYKLPDDYNIDGKSLIPYLFTGSNKHRDWVYSYRGPEQMIRGRNVLKDGKDKWYDVSGNPDDLISFKQIKNWKNVMETHRAERKKLQKVLPKYDLYFDEYNEPGVPVSKKQKKQKRPRYSRKSKN